MSRNIDRRDAMDRQLANQIADWAPFILGDIPDISRKISDKSANPEPDHADGVRDLDFWINLKSGWEFIGKLSSISINNNVETAEINTIGVMRQFIKTGERRDADMTLLPDKIGFGKIMEAMDSRDSFDITIGGRDGFFTATKAFFDRYEFYSSGLININAKLNSISFTPYP